MRVLIVTAKRREAQHDRLVLHHQVDDILNGTLGLLKIQSLAITRRLSQIADYIGGFAIRGFRACFMPYLRIPILRKILL